MDGNTRPPFLSGQESTIRTGHGTTDWFQIGKGVCQSCLFSLYAEYIMWNARLDEAQTGMKIARRNISNLRYADDTPFRPKAKRNWRASWWKWKRRLKKLTWNSTFRKLRYDIRSHPFMANRWENNGNSDRLFSWAPKSLQMVTAAMKLKDACSLGEKLWPA